MKKRSRCVGVAVTFLLFASLAFAGEIDILVRKLVEKGALTPGEGQQIMVQTKENMRTLLAQGKIETVPGWTQRLSLKGDFRYRHQWEKYHGEKEVERNRQRVRFRLGLNANVAPGFTTAAGLCTGGADPRSTNQTLENSFETPDIRLDYAYGSYSPPVAGLDMSFTGGKFPENMLIWHPSDLLLDTDIAFNGVMGKLGYAAGPAKMFLGAGGLVLDEVRGKQSNPGMYVIQPGADFKLSNNLSAKAAVAYYAFTSIAGKRLDHSALSNSGYEKDKVTGLTIGGLKYKYDSVNPNLEISIRDVLPTVLPYMAVFSDLVYNPDPEDKNLGYLGGLKLGHRSVRSAGQWQLAAMYRHLEKDAFLDVFPDSDAYGGKTGVNGTELILQYGIARNVSLGIDWYNMGNIDGIKKVQNLVQVDIGYRF